MFDPRNQLWVFLFLGPIRGTDGARLAAWANGLGAAAPAVSPNRPAAAAAVCAPHL